jgi:glycosyltransferase involved in cell wall biosynthesis
VRVAHFISSLGIFGAENVLLSLAQYRHQKNLPVFVIGIEHRSQAGQVLMQKAQALGIPTCSLKSSSRFDLKLIHNLRKSLQDNHIEVLHTHNYKSTLIGWLAARPLNIALVATVHGYTDMNGKVSLYEALDRFVLRISFDQVAVVQEKLLSDMPAAKRVVIRNGIDIKKFARSKEEGQRIRQQYHIHEDDFVIGSVGRLSPEKNQKFLLETAALIMKQNPKVKVLLVGDGSERKNLEALCKKLHIESNVVLTGIAEDVASMYQAMDVFVLSSLTEGIPLTILEAMASRVAVVATRVGGIPQIVHDKENGLLVDSQDVTALKAKIEWLMQNPQQRQTLAKAGAVFVEQKCSLGNMGRQYEQVYESAITKRKKS